MPDIAASDVTYTLLEGTRHSTPTDPRQEAVYDIAYGNGTLTYPTGGIPLTRAKMACPTRIESFNIMDSSGAGAAVVKYDSSNNKLRIYVSGTELVGGSGVPAATSIRAVIHGW